MPRRAPSIPRKQPTQGRAQHTVDAIIDATAHILVRDGYEGLSTNRVAERAGVSIGSLYQYFPNKEALVGELVDRQSAILYEMVTRALHEMRDHEPRAVVGSVTRAVLRTKRARPKLFKILRERAPGTGRMTRYEAELARIIELGAEFLGAHQASLRVRNPELTAFVLVHAIDALTHAAATRRDGADDDEVIAAIDDLVSRYLLPD